MLSIYLLIKNILLTKNISLKKISIEFLESLSYKPYAKSTGLLTASLFAITLSGCSTVSLEQKTVAETIELQRGNIVTQNKLSAQTISSLMAYGMDENACLSNFDVCLEQLKEVKLLESERQTLALMAELHYAKSKQIEHSTTCQVQINRPPIDPYYANAPIPAKELEQLHETIKKCNDSHLSHLVSAIRYSYAYLFYNSLDGRHIDSNSDESNLRLLASDTEVQTKDIYNATTASLVKILYTRQQSGFSDYNVTHFESTDFGTAYMEDSGSLADSSSISLDQSDINPLLTDDTNSIPASENNDTIRSSGLHQTMSVTIKDISEAVRTDKEVVLDVYLPNEVDYIADTYRPNYNNADYSKNSNTKITSKLYSTYDLSFSGLNSISQREGVGVSFVTQLTNRQTTSITDFIDLRNDSAMTTSDEQLSAEDRIYRTGNLLLTGVVLPKGESVNEVINSTQIDINLYNPSHVESVRILKEDYRLAANFSANYGLWLSENKLRSAGRLNLLIPQQNMVLPQLYKLEPYDPNKRIIIMVHGLASSPETWVGVTNDIFNDDELRKNYQVWQVFYPTQIPMIENRYQIQHLLKTAYNQVDPNNEHEASRHSVIISHSMGAVLSRMMLSNDDLAQKLDELDDSSRDRELNRLIRQSFAEQNVDARLNLNKLDHVDRAVFISAPFKGTDFADRWFTRALRRIIQLPLGFVRTITGNLTSIATEGELAQNPLGALYLQNGASQLSDQSSFMRLTRDISIDDTVTFHSIIANDDPDIAEGLAQLAATKTRADLSQQHSEDNSSRNNRLYTDDDIMSEDYRVSGLDVPDELASGSAISGSAADMAVAAVNVQDDISQSLTNRISDGIVPYKSAHLEGAASETIITGGHSIQDSPQAILILRRILHEQLEQYPIKSSNAESLEAIE